MTLGSLGSSWQLLAARDFDGNGVADLLWFNPSTTEAVLWQLYPSNVVRAVSLGTGGAGWAIAQVGDFDGDGRADLFWRNAGSGQNIVWYMNGPKARQTEFLPSVPSAWTPLGVADYNRDGRDDLIWINNSAPASVVQWAMKVIAPPHRHRAARYRRRLDPGRAKLIVVRGAPRQ